MPTSRANSFVPDPGAGVAAVSSQHAVWIACSVLGLSLSYLSSGLLLRVGGFYVPELGVLASLLLMLKALPAFRAAVRRISRSDGVKLLALMVCLQLFLGLFREGANPVSLYATLRAYVLLCVGLVAGWHLWRLENPAVGERAVVIICLVSSAASILYAVMSSGDGGSVKSQIPIVAATLAFGIALSRAWCRTALVALAILILAAIVGFYRQYAVMAGICLILLAWAFFPIGVVVRSGRTAIQISGQRLIGAICLTIMVAVAYVVFWDGVMAYFESDAGRYTQTIGKWTDLVSFFQTGVVTRSELGRAEGIGYLLENWLSFALPNGFVDADAPVLYSIWGGDPYVQPDIILIRDSLMAFLVVYFGFLFTALMLMVFGTLVLRKLWMTHGRNGRIALISVLSVLVVCWFLDGMAATSIEKSLFTGLAIAYATALRPKHQAQVGQFGVKPIDARSIA